MGIAKRFAIILAVIFFIVNTGLDAGNKKNHLTKDHLTLWASSFIGGSENEISDAVAIGPNGDIYMTGGTKSPGFPVTKNAYKNPFAGNYDVFVACFSPDLKTLKAATIIGGSKFEEGTEIIVDKKGNVYVAGFTESPDFPVGKNGFDTTFNGGGDAFILKFSPNLDRLLASTLLGGKNKEEGYTSPGLAIDKTGNVIIAAQTSSPDFPVTPGAYDTTHNGDDDIFVAKLDPGLKRLLSATFLGGSGEERFDQGIALFPDGRLVITGITQSPNFPVTSGAYDTKFGGLMESFIAIMSPDLSKLHHSTFLGGPGTNDFTYCLLVGTGGNIYVGGHGGKDWPATPRAYNNIPQGQPDMAYITKLSPDLSRVLASTYLKGTHSGSTGAKCILDLGETPSGQIVATGWVSVQDFPSTPGAFDETYNGNTDWFVLAMDKNLEKLTYSTFIGGTGKERWNKMALDAKGNIYGVGYTGSKDFPMPPGAWDISYNGGNYDAVIYRFSAAKKTTGPNPVFLAAKTGSVKKLEKILAKEPGKVNAADRDQRLPVHWAARYGKAGAIAYLLEKGSPTGKKDNKGLTALHLACIYNHAEAVEVLLKKGADRDAADNEGWTPVHRAAVHGSHDVLKHFKAGKIPVGGPDPEGNTLLHLAVYFHHDKAVKVLLENKAKVTGKNKKGQTPLHRACQSIFNMNIMDMLLKKGAKIEARDNEMKTPLHIAVISWARENAKLLIGSKANINAQDNKGNTPLHHAVEKSDYYESMVRYLLEKGADKTIKNKKGQTPLDIAKAGKFQKLIQLLQK